MSLPLRNEEVHVALLSDQSDSAIDLEDVRIGSSQQSPNPWSARVRNKFTEGFARIPQAFKQRDHGTRIARIAQDAERFARIARIAQDRHRHHGPPPPGCQPTKPREPGSSLRDLFFPSAECKAVCKSLDRAKKEQKQAQKRRTIEYGASDGSKKIVVLLSPETAKFCKNLDKTMATHKRQMRRRGSA